MKQHATDEILINTSSALKLVPVSRATLLRWAKKGAIPSVTIGKQRFFRKSDIIDAITPKTNNTQDSQGTQTILGV